MAELYGDGDMGRRIRSDELFAMGWRFSTYSIPYSEKQESGAGFVT